MEVRESAGFGTREKERALSHTHTFTLPRMGEISGGKTGPRGPRGRTMLQKKKKRKTRVARETAEIGDVEEKARVCKETGGRAWLVPRWKKVALKSHD